MMDFNVSPEEKMNNYLEFNQNFPIYQSNPLETGFSLRNPKDVPTINAFSGAKPIIAKGSNLNKPIKDINNESDVSTEVSPLDKLKSIYQSANEYRDLYPSVVTTSTGPVNIQDLKRQIAQVESEGMGGYEAQNKDSTAVGKYQFLWGKKAGKGWGDSIKAVTGVKSKEEFKKNPTAQEKYFDFYAEKTLKPQAAILKKEFPNSGLSDADLMKGIHFQGLGKEDRSNGMRKVLSKNLHTAKLQKNNLSFYDYLKVSNK